MRIYHDKNPQLGHAAGVCSSCALCGLGADTGALKSEAFGAMGDGLHPMIFPQKGG